MVRVVDLVNGYAQSLQTFVELVRQVPAEQYDLPTPCADWTVRELINHIVYEDRWTVPLLAGATIAEIGDRFDGDLLGDDPVAAVTDAARQAGAAVAEPDALTRTVHLSFGDTPCQEYLHQLFADHLVHGWDLAAATGLDRRLDPDLVALCAEWFAEREAAYRRAGAIGERVDVPADASTQDRLLAAFGRRPDWTP